MNGPGSNTPLAASSFVTSSAIFGQRYFTRRRFELFGLVLLVLLTATGRAGADAFTEQLALARGYEKGYPYIGVEKDSEKALAHYRRALDLRPNHPENMAVAFRIGGILISMDGNPERQREGARVFEKLLETYDYMDYYEANPHYSSDSPQFNMITAAIYAAGYQEPEKARATYLKGMEFLTATYRRRLEQWKNEKAPVRPTEDNPFEGGPLELSKWESRYQAWAARQEKAVARDVFPPDTLERVFVASLLSGYIETSRLLPEKKLPEILAPVIQAFPDSPFEKRARDLIAASGRD